jgi:hypothetical protein
MKQQVTVHVNTLPVPQVCIAQPGIKCDMIAEPELRAKPGRFAGHGPQANETGCRSCDTHTDAGDHNRNNQTILHYPSDSFYHSIFAVALHRFNPGIAFGEVRTPVLLRHEGAVLLAEEATPTSLADYLVQALDDEAKYLR